MVMKTLSSTEAKKHFRAFARMVQKEPVAITRKGKTGAVALSPEGFERFLDGKELDIFRKISTKPLSQPKNTPIP